MALSVELIRTAFTRAQLIIQDEVPQIVFAGRSNVGKSSLLNALFGQKLAKISSKPGKTQSVNYYALKAKSLYLVDLPGYGYAKASQEQRKQWGELLEAFFTDNQKIVLVCLLLDARLPPQAKDLEMVNFAQDRGYKLQGILTKADKCSFNQIKVKLKEWQVILNSELLISSGKTKLGIDKLSEYLLNFAL
ncbi:MAG: YihA family ribosome biogenesis GTP-binding protein [Desulfovibrionaceae bacterium]|nr:YihA family ribosome biogenesis GTP-binding protein [Desulfovibrionaceae bacterium]